MQSPTIIFLSLCFLLVFSNVAPNDNETPYPLLVASNEKDIFLQKPFLIFFPNKQLGRPLLRYVYRP
jgi:hypothetical protein